MFFEVTRPVRGGPTGATASTQLERPLEMAEFDAEPGKCREGVDDQSAPVAGVAIALLGSDRSWTAQSTQSGLPGRLALVTRALLARTLVAVPLFAGGRPVAEVAVYVVDGPLVAALRGGDGVDGRR
jgi:hypothetical protein